ncbi:Eukaryotic RNA Recognition Motif (RRM) profile [Nakaseomyces glabratus]|nr:Eukaryotic RNA Recognition Motif (RRM) profile [Nakaseomyces glabratus]KAH7592345.1 Eukaryotic RNA Recognition Motif (RRM) profile [Nakaseomyces glabratus]KTB15847.1 Protein JSN1 [Nakaseomyces glabratus]KTB27048.1 Protein JSN1 [Nakaseomyces glabratus]
MDGNDIHNPRNDSRNDRIDRNERNERSESGDDLDESKRISYRSKKERFASTLNSILPSISAKFHSRKNVNTSSDAPTDVTESTGVDYDKSKDRYFMSDGTSVSDYRTAFSSGYQQGSLYQGNNYDTMSNSSKDLNYTPITYASMETSPNYLNSQQIQHPGSSGMPLISPQLQGHVNSMSLPQNSNSLNLKIGNMSAMTNNNLPIPAQPNNVWQSMNSNSTPISLPQSVPDPFEHSNPPVSGLNNTASLVNSGFDRERAHSFGSFQNGSSHYGSDMSLHYSLNNNTASGYPAPNAATQNIPAVTTSTNVTTSVPQMQQQEQLTPVVADDVDPALISWVSTNINIPASNQTGFLLPTNTLCISNVFPLQTPGEYGNNNLSHPINLTSTLLASLCSQYGKVLSSRTLRHLNIALVEFETVDSAITALESLQGKELSLLGFPCSAAFAKILSVSDGVGLGEHTLSVKENSTRKPLLHEVFLNTALYQGSNSTFTLQSNLQPPVVISQPSKENISTKNASNVHLSSADNDPCPFKLPPAILADKLDDFQDIIKKFNIKYDVDIVNHMLNNSLQKGPNACDVNNFGPIPQQSVHRQFDAPKLRELRKAFDSNSLSQVEMEQLAIAMLDELPELCLDYSGNTIIQKLYDNCSPIIVDLMLRESHKYLTSMGIHKNGTWVSQKIIKVVKTPRQMDFITKGIQDYCTALFNDQYGNYVIQGVLTFGFPWNSFIFENIMSNFWVIVDNKFGVRAVRACLEANGHMSKEQELLLCSMIILYSEYLSTSNTGTLLVTWYLDSCTFEEKYAMIISSLIPHIVELCSHRLGSLTILKLLNLRIDQCVKDSILTAIFGDLNDNKPSENLIEILKDNHNGGSFLYKIISSRFLESERKSHLVEKIKIVLLNSNLAHQNKRLIEEVGLTSTGNGNGMSQPIRHRKTISYSHSHESARQSRDHTMPNRVSYPKSIVSAGSYLSPNGITGIGHNENISPDMALYLANSSPNLLYGSRNSQTYQQVPELQDLSLQLEGMKIHNDQNYFGQIQSHTYDTTGMPGHDLLANRLDHDESGYNMSYNYR